MSTEVEKAKAILGFAQAIVLIALTPIFITANAFCIATMWRWFVVRKFDVAPLGILDAAGLSILILFLRPLRHEKDTRGLGERITDAVLNYVVYMTVAYIVHCMQG